MKQILTILFLSITSIAFSQQKFTVKVQGNGSVFDSSQINEKLAEKLNVSDTTTTVATNYRLDTVKANIQEALDLKLNTADAFTQTAADALYRPITYVPSKSDVGLGNVDNTSDVNKPVSNAMKDSLNLKANTIDAILNQNSLKENKVSRYRRATLDTLTNQASTGLLFDWRSGSYLFQFDSKRLILSNGNEGINIGTGSGFNYESNRGNTNFGYNSGFLNNGTYTTLTGDRTGMYAKSSYSAGYGTASLYAFTGNNTSAYGPQSGYFSNGDGLSYLGYYSGYGVNADSSTFVGANSGQVFDFTDTVASSTGHNVTYSSIFAVSWSGSDISAMITTGGLVTGKIYPYYLDYTGTKPQINTIDVNNQNGKLLVASPDSIILLTGAYYNTTGTGSFNISITTRRLNNSQVLGNGARADLSNQVVLGNDKITQQKWGGSGNIRWATNIAPVSEQVPVWNGVSGQFEPADISRIDTVLSSSALSTYAGSAFTLTLSDTLQGGTFIYTPTTLVADNGVIFPATGKGTGSWVREYDKSKGVNVDWFGTRKDVAIQKAIIAAGVNGTINFTGSGIYELSDGFVLLQGQTVNGNGATIKRVADSVVTLTQPVTTSSTYLIVNAIPSSWYHGQVQIFSDTGSVNQVTSAFILRTSGDTVFVNGAINRVFSAGASVRKVFALLASTATGVKIKNFVFDGNKSNVKANYSWSVNPSISMTSTGTSSIEGCRFYNTPSENIVGHGLIIKNNYAQNLNGSFVHLSASWKSSGQQLIPTIIEGNITDSTNQIASSVTGHSEGVITNSYTPGYVTIVNNRFRNGKDGVFGYIQNTTAPTDGKYRNVLIANNYAENFSKIFSSISVNSTTDTVRTGHIFVDGNTFNNCGINDWTSQQSNINNNIDTIMIGNNLLVGGTVWKIPIQKSDSLQRYVLNNPTSTPQGGDINITGIISASSIHSNTPALSDSSNTVATTDFVKQKLASKRDTSYHENNYMFKPLYNVQRNDTAYETHIDTLSSIKDGILLAGGITADGDTLATKADVRAAGGNQSLQEVTDIGAISNKKITVDNLNLSGIGTFGNDSLAHFVGNLNLNDVYNDSSGFLKVLKTNYQMGFTINADTHQQQFSIYSTGANLGLTVDWGDGTVVTYAANNRFQYPSHTYSAAGNYTIALYNFNDSTMVQGIDFTYGTKLIGVTSISHLNLMTSLRQLLMNQSIYSDAGFDLSGMASLKELSLYDCDITSFDPIALPATLNDVTLSNNLMSETLTNHVLTVFDAATFNAGAKALKITLNSAPSGAGLTAITSLESKGWTITHD